MALIFSNGLIINNIYVSGGVPDAPVSVLATALSSSTASVSFSAPSRIGDSPITSYGVVSNPGNITATTATVGTVIVSGLSSGTNYSFLVYAVNSYGNSITASSNVVKTFTIPDAPTIGTVTAVGSTATVAFTAPANNGGYAITSYTATSSPGGITGTVNQSGSGSITVSGLTIGSTYTFTVHATNIMGNSAESSASGSITILAAPSSISYTTAGTYSWVAPSGVTKVSIVAIGGGGASCIGGLGAGGGGGLGYKNNYSVTSGNSYTVVVGSRGNFTSGSGKNGTISYFCSTSVLYANGGAGGGGIVNSGPNTLASSGGGGGVYLGCGGGGGGRGGSVYRCGTTAGGYGGGGGAGGYSGCGGAGADWRHTSSNSPGSAGAGGGGGGAGANAATALGAGGTGLYGQGTSGAGGACSSNGSGGSGGNNGAGGYGGLYGGGGLQGNCGAVRIVWPGNTRQFPSTCVGTP